ncbi:hypothetical protein ABPG75_010278 [Micractinium tetrahymenae]
MANDGHGAGIAFPEDKQGVHLYSMCSPNGCEQGSRVNVLKGQQREPQFLAINPVGKIPAIVDFDADHNGLKVFESGAILCHIADTRDPEHKLLPRDPCQRAEALSWLFFHTSTLVPIAQTVSVPLVLGAPSLKSQGILDRRLGDTGGWLAAGRYTIADIAHLGMVLLLKYILGLHLKTDYPHLAAWLDRRGMNVPEPCWLLVEGPREEKMAAIRERA